MKSIKTVKCRLEVNKETEPILQESLKRFADCCNDVLSVSKEHKTTNKVKLQHLCYHQLKAKYQLPANLVIRAIARVAESAKGKKPPKQYRPTSIAYDQRTFCFVEPKEEISISTHAERLHIKLRLGNFQRRLLVGQKPTSATLSYKRNNTFYINIVLQKTVDVPSGNNPVGIDRGLYNIATTTKGQTFSGKKIMQTRKHYSELRQRLQTKGTKSAKRRLKQLSGREKRWMTDTDHCISRAIINSCQTGDIIVMEDLKYIRDRVKIQKKQKLFMHSWSFYQLQNFIEYKSLEVVIPVIYIDPHYTSQNCSKCGQKGIRVKHSFVCLFCGHKNNADFNASYNIQKASLAFLDGVQSITPLVPVQEILSETKNVANVEVKVPEQLLFW